MKGLDAVVVPIGDKQRSIPGKPGVAYCSQPLMCVTFRGDEGSGREIFSSGLIQCRRDWHRGTGRRGRSRWSRIATDQVRVLTGNEEVAIWTKGDGKWVIETWICFSLLDKDIEKSVLLVFVQFPAELEYLGGIMVRIGDVEIPIRPKRHATQLSQLETFRERLDVELFAGRRSIEIVGVDIVPFVPAFAAMECDVPALHDVTSLSFTGGAIGKPGKRGMFPRVSHV